MTFIETIKKINDRSLRLTVIGGGYVGLPTAALFANAGFHVDVSDIKPEIINMINTGSNFVNEPGLRDIVSNNVKVGRLFARLNNVDYEGTNVFLIAVQTPMDEEKKPNLKYLLKCMEDIGKNMRRDTVVVVCSTIPSGTMMRELKPTLESLSGLRADSEFYLVFAPERIAPGKALIEFTNGTRLIGGIGPNSTQVGAELFKTVCKNVLFTDATAAEVAKLAENTFRDINIAFANQLALLCEELHTDVMTVIRIANTHPRVNIHSPGPGVGGPCLTKDPYYLLDGIAAPHFDIITTSRAINDQMPEHVVTLVLRALSNIGKNPAKSRITILGVTYKKDTDDLRNSPAEPIVRSLVSLHSEVVVFDPYCINESFGAKRAQSLFDAVTGSDCIVIVTDHSDFMNMDLQKIKTVMKNKSIIIDSRRIIDPNYAEKAGFRYYGVGLGM